MLFLTHCSATIVETGHAACHHCAANNADSAASTATQQFSITLTGGLASTSSVEVWHTSNATMFEHTGKGTAVSGGKISMSIEPESIYTITTTTGQSKGSFAAPPAASAPFPADWSDDFDSGVVESLAKYWADQCGSFQVMPAGGGRSGLVLFVVVHNQRVERGDVRGSPAPRGSKLPPEVGGSISPLAHDHLPRVPHKPAVCRSGRVYGQQPDAGHI